MKILNFIKFFQSNQKMDNDSGQNKEMITEILFENTKFYLKDSHMSYDFNISFNAII